MDSQFDSLNKLRQDIVRMVYNAGEGHIPSAFSIVDILYVLYQSCLNHRPSDPNWTERDYFILSKGHAGAALYSTLSHFGYFDEKHLLQYCKPGAILGGHPDATKVPGVEVSSGSLGHGIGIGVGIALGLKRKNLKNKVVCLVGDGEMDEGSVWESFMLARSLELSNLVVIADCNSSQKYWNAFDFAKIMASFGWNSAEVDGHDLKALKSLLSPLLKTEQTAPSFVRANTEKGHGVKRFIGDHGWHRRTPTATEFEQIMAELT